MTVVYRDPKSGGDTWGTNELLTPTQINYIANNQRHFARAQWMGLTQVTPAQPVFDVDSFLVDSSLGTKRVYWVGANGTSDTSNVLLSQGSEPVMTGTAHGQTMTGINGIYSAGSRPDDNAWWGLESQAGISAGYLRWSGPSGSYGLVNRAGTSTGVKRANAIAYSPDVGVLVAVWSDGYVEWNTTGTSWSGQRLTSANLSYVLYGNGYFVAMPNLNTSGVFVSSNGTSWSSVDLGVTTTTGARLAFDAGENVWYVCKTDTSGANLTVLASSSPATSWATVSNVTTPEINGTLNGFVAHGGIWGVMSDGLLFVSLNHGQTWVAQAASGTSALVWSKFAGGRLHLSSIVDARYHYTQPFFTPYETI